LFVIFGVNLKAFYAKLQQIILTNKINEKKIKQILLHSFIQNVLKTF